VREFACRASIEGTEGDAEEDLEEEEEDNAWKEGII
jgi:hypothetical protein